MLYFNNAATTWPKPEIVYLSVDDSFRNLNSPDRTAGSDGRRSSQMLETCRNEIAEFFGIGNCSRLVFTPSCTYSLNNAILCQKYEVGDVIVTSGLEHHAVSRPVCKLAREQKVEVKVAPYRSGSPFDLEFLESELKSGKVKLVCSTMASNVTGEIMPVAEIGKLCREHGARFLVDAAQSAGVLPIDVEKMNIDFLAFAGHKSLFGPPGVGGLFVRDGIELTALAEGGTGGNTGNHIGNLRFPTSFEVGTHNLLGIVGVNAGIRWVQQVGMSEILKHERLLTQKFIEGIQDIPGIRIFGDGEKLSVVSLVFENISPNKIATWLADEKQVVTRAGYHCATMAHETIGTLPGEGTVRFSFGFSNTQADISQVVECMQQIPQLSLN